VPEAHGDFASKDDAEDSELNLSLCGEDAVCLIPPSCPRRYSNLLVGGGGESSGVKGYQFAGGW